VQAGRSGGTFFLKESLSNEFTLSYLWTCDFYGLANSWGSLKTSRLFIFSAGIEARASCMLGKHSTTKYISVHLISF
jgi:hypothetical protein